MKPRSVSPPITPGISKRFGSPHARTVLFLWIGENRIQLGELAHEGKRSRWQEWERRAISGSASADLAAALATLPSELPANTRQDLELRVVVADTWLAEATLPWCAELLTPDSARLFTVHYLQSLGFDVSPDDEIRLDDAPYGSARLAIAYPRPLLNRLAELATGWNVHWRSLRPLSVLAWDVLSRRRASLKALLFDNREQVTLCLAAPHTSKGSSRLQEVKTLPYPTGLSHANALKLLWERQCLRAPASGEIDEIVVLDATGLRTDEHWSPPFVAADKSLYHLRLRRTWLNAHHTGALALDAHATPARRGWRHWLMTLLLGLGVGALGVSYWAQSRQAESLQRALLAAQSAQHRERAPTLNREDSLKVGMINAAIRELNLPIQAVLKALRPPRDIRVSVLQVETAAAKSANESNLLRITAEAASSAEMIRYVAHVSEQRPFVRATLKRHEMLKPDAQFGERFHFIMEAEWNE